MERNVSDGGSRQGPDSVLGYLNYSSGAHDPSFFARWNALWESAETEAPDDPLGWVLDWLTATLDRSEGSTPAFADLTQARSVVGLVRDACLPAYVEFHRDLLFHHTRATLFQPFLVGRIFEAVLQAGAPWSERDRIVSSVIDRLNDFVGHRPVATLETQKHEPYAHEWVRPIPVHIRGAGTAVGPYRNIIERALELLADAPESILAQARFDLSLLDELAIDPRAYDFDHPANQRPNHHFGQWDPHQIDGQGHYRRFVLQDVTLGSLKKRVDESQRLGKGELELEAAVVLGGTMLMASGISGDGPNAFESTLSLADLLTGIASFRDAYYDAILEKIPGRQGDRLRREAVRRRQAFGGARQHLNAELARRRAAQLAHLQLARIYSNMGYPSAAAKQAEVVQAASARIHCRIECSLTEGLRLVRAGQLDVAADQLPRIHDLVRRGIECGAIVDPWNILGFDAHFTLFASSESSIHDHRIEELLQLMESWFAFCANLWSEAAARSDSDVAERVERAFREVVAWWRRFAAHACSSVRSPDPEHVFRSAQLVAEALGAWHQGGAAAGDVAYWAPHAKLFPSPEAYALVVESLLARHDFIASMALLMHWLSESDRIPLMQGEASFLRLATSWLGRLAEKDEPGPGAAEARWRAARRFFDFLEANAEQHWRVPRFELGTSRRSSASDRAKAESVGDGDDPDNDADGLFGAAYEEMVYIDQTDDGIDAPIYESESKVSEDEFDREANRLVERLSFLRCVARLWKTAAIHVGFRVERREDLDVKAEYLARWSDQAAANREELIALLDVVGGYRLPATSGDHESMVQYDRRRTTRDTLLEHAIAAAVDMGDAALWLRAAAEPAPVSRIASADSTGAGHPESMDESRAVQDALRALLRGDETEFRKWWHAVEIAFQNKSLLYVPVTKGGDPRRIVAARARRRMIQDLLIWLPRAGFLLESCRLIETARTMDRVNTVGAGAVTEYDELFTLGFRSLVDSVLASFGRATREDAGQKSARSERIMECLESLTESMLMSWLAHSQMLRLSALEYLYDDQAWRDVLQFIKRHGRELFTQRFFGLGNIRAILHEGAGEWLEQLARNPNVRLSLLDDLDIGIPRDKVVRYLTLILDAVVENYAEYRDYNSTTTQSDRGDMLYVLLDFLRLLSRYERISWNMRPVVLAHERLVRRGFHHVARKWRGELTRRIGDKAGEFVTELRKMQRRYAIQMPTVADRIHERFTQPLMIDRIRALVEPAIQQAHLNDPSRQIAFALLEHDAAMMAKEPSGAGLDVPVWIEAIQDEVDHVRRPPHARDDDERLGGMLPRRDLSPDQILGQLRAWSEELGRANTTLRLRWSE
ncbi:MAG: hypothetical protein FJ297_17870 [Planctomycetes bacterium]|nr:hypothetical protein [Planctomycetota bacterium]